jgi:uncharacterized LabA/DUF88 family protein
MARKVSAYIDGFNLYFGIRSANLRRYLWLDLSALMSSFLLPDQELVATKYFTSRIAALAESVRRQSDYIDVLAARGVTVIEGRHSVDPDRCECGRHYASTNEKMTDVNIALEIVRDAYQEKFDTAFLVTGDADQVPTIRLIRELFPSKRVVVLFPPERVSRHLRGVAHVHLNINENRLRLSQLPDQVEVKPGVVLRRPQKWKSE